MIAGHVRVKLEPQSLDAVLVGTVWRQEVQPEAATPLRQRCLDDLAVMDDVVVEDEMKHRR